MKANRMYGVFKTRIGYDGDPEEHVCVDRTFDRPFAMRIAKRLRSERTPDEKKYRDNFKVRVVEEDDPKYIEWKKKIIICDIRKDCKRPDFLPEGSEEVVDDILRKHKFSLEEIELWNWNNFIMEEGVSEESISTFTHTSCWSTSYSGFIEINSTIYEGKGLKIGPVTRV